jgi:signal transduction histidine kinase
MLGAAVTLALLCAGHAHGACLQLPSADLRRLDDLAEGYPERGLAEADRQLALAANRRDSFTQAQLYAVIAAVRSDQGRSADVHAAVAAARKLLDTLPATAAAQVLRDRLAISDGANAATRSDLLPALQSINETLARAPAGSVVRVCALAARADLRAELLELDGAAADGIAAYATAERRGFDAARIQAAISLAEIYRRSGLRDEAERMLDEFISYERAHDHPAQVASALYMRGQILTEARNYGEARAALDASRRMAEESGDHSSAIFTDVALCPALIGAGELDAAGHVCSEHTGAFALAGRDDITTLMKAYLARIDLERGRPAAALGKLDDVLGRHARDVVANLEPQIYLDRARARAALGQLGGAYLDVKRSLELQQSLDRDQRARSAAVLKGAADAEKLAVSNRLLEERLARQRAELSNRTLAQRLAVAIAAAAAVVSALFGYLFWMARRHERYIRRQDAVLRTVSSHAPDALMLLDPQRRVLFCNRDLFGGLDTPEPGQALDGVVPREALQAVQDALVELFDHRRPTTFAANVTDPSGLLRQFELRGVPVIVDGHLLGATLRSVDITDIRRLEREVVDVATRERKRLSNDLHEGLGQDLAGISLLLESLGMDIDRGRPVASAAVRQLTAHVNRMIGATRDIAYALSPVQIARGSLSSAIARLVGEASSALKVGITMKSDPTDIIVPEDTADHLCRIAVEAVTVAARHSGCANIEVELRVQDGVLRLTIADDGSEVATGADNAGDHAAQMIAYRARLLGGSVHIESGPRRGTRTSVTVPVTRAA